MAYCGSSRLALRNGWMASIERQEFNIKACSETHAYLYQSQKRRDAATTGEENDAVMSITFHRHQCVNAAVEAIYIH